MSETVYSSWRTPTLIKGAALALAGFAFLAAPQPSLTFARFALAAFLVVSGVIAYWGRLLSHDNDTGLLRGILSLATGLGLFLAPVDTIRWLELIAAAYLALQSVLALFEALIARRRGQPGSAPIVRGVFFLLLAALLLVLPRETFGITVAALAIVAIFIGLIMVAWSARHSSQFPGIASRAQAAEVIWNWLNERDFGSDRRDAIADQLYFEVPNRQQRLVSYVTMLLLSTALASLAVLQDSTAVIIGAMLVSPLMTPIMGCAAGLVAGWRMRVLRSLMIVAVSALVGVGLAWILASWIPSLVPLENNQQVLSRVSPTLLDMAVALAAGAAGAYATLDDRVSASLTGVAIAVALVPPLGVAGVCLQAGLLAETGGALLLFTTNLVSIIFSASIVFLVFGFAPARARERRKLTNADVINSLAIVALLIMLPLGLTGQNVLESINRANTVQTDVTEWLSDSPDLNLLWVKVRDERVGVRLSGSGDVPDIALLERRLSDHLDTRVVVRVELFPSVILTAPREDEEGSASSQ